MAKRSIILFIDKDNNNSFKWLSNACQNVYKMAGALLISQDKIWGAVTEVFNRKADLC